MWARLGDVGIVLVYVLLYLIMIAGVLIIPFGVPGQFVMVAAAIVFVLVSGTEVMSLWVVGALLVMAIGAELLEATAGFLGAKNAQGSLWSSFGALGGGLVGAIIGSFVLPVIGSLIGAFLGPFGAAFAVQYTRTQAFSQSGHVARGALIGRIIGSIIKVFTGAAMIAVITIALIY